MNHDPLCPMWSKVWAGDRCECVLIAKVREDMLAKCITAVEAVHSPIPIDEHLSYCRGCADAAYEEYSYAWPCAVVTALRALQEVDTPQQEINEHINFDTANRIGDDTTLQNAGREPYKSPNGYDPRAAENRP